VQFVREERSAQPTARW